jgi:DNA recombination protein RmuC
MSLEIVIIIVFLCIFSLILGGLITSKVLPSFLKSTFRDTAKEAISEVTKEVSEKQDEYEDDISSQLKEVEKSLVQASTIWKTNTESIAKEVSDLSKSHIQWAEALSNPGEQGALAEEALEVMLETAGLVKGINFDTQITETTDQGRLRPDFYIYTPDDGVIVIDSKAPMKIYREAVDSDDIFQKEVKLKEHAKSMLGHAKALGKKDYTQAVNKKTPDNVIMFVPNIAIYLSACEQIPDLIQQAWKHRVTICPPEAVYPILKNIMLTWQQKKLYENAEEIQIQALEIHKRLKKFHGYFSKIGKDLNNAVKAFNDGAKSWESRLNPAFRKIENMGIADSTRQIDETNLIEENVKKTNQINEE